MNPYARSLALHARLRRLFLSSAVGVPPPSPDVVPQPQTPHPVPPAEPVPPEIVEPPSPAPQEPVREPTLPPIRGAHAASGRHARH